MKAKWAGDLGQQVELDAGIARAVLDFAMFDGEPDQTIGGYAIVRRLGRGGAGSVFLALRPGGEGTVALKVIDRELGSDGAPAHVERELRALAACRCPEVPAVLDYGLHEGRVFIAFEYVEGEPLDRFVDQSSRSVRDRIAILARAAGAVQSLHERGILHRDLKPSNLLVEPSGEVRVIDLGSSGYVELSELHERTLEGTVLGTPAYMAPEQARGEISQVSVRSDLFALGAIGFSLVSGETPFSMAGDRSDVLRRIGHGHPRRIRGLVDGVPRDLAAVLDRAVAATPSDRFETVAEFRAELRRWLAGEPVRTRSAGAVRRCWMFGRRRPLAFALRAVLVAGVALIAWLGSYGLASARLAHDRQLVIEDHAAQMEVVARQAQMLLDRGALERAVVPLVGLGRFVRGGGELDQGLVRFTEDFEALVDTYQMKE